MERGAERRLDWAGLPVLSAADAERPLQSEESEHREGEIADRAGSLLFDPDRGRPRHLAVGLAHP